MTQIDTAVIGFPCDWCGKQIGDDDYWCLLEDGEGHQRRVHEGCQADALFHCPQCQT